MLNLQQVLLILKARIWYFLLTFVIVFALVVGVTLLLPKKYEATAALVLNYKGVDPVTGFAIPSSLMTSYMTTQMGVIKSHRVALKVGDNVNITESQVIQDSFQQSAQGQGDIRDWAAKFIVNSLKVVPDKGSNIINLEYTSKSPQFSKLMADAFAESYMQINAQMSNQPSQTASSYLYDQKDLLKTKLREAQTNLLKYKQDNGITGDIENYDIEASKLASLSAQLAAAQGQTIEAMKRNSIAARGTLSPDVVANPLVQGLKMQVSQAEANVAELGRNLASNHPKMQSARAQLNKLKSELRAEISRAQSNVKNTARIFSQREAELKKAVAMQKKKLLKFNRNRDELSVLQNEVESALLAFNNINARISQTDLEGSTNQSDAIVLNQAVLPTSPASPRVVMNVFFGFFAALFLGLLVAYLKEALDRRVRCIKDLEDSVDLPVIIMMGKRTSSVKKRLLGNNANLGLENKGA